MVRRYESSGTDMAHGDIKDNLGNPNRTGSTSTYPYVVLTILFLLTTGATIAYHQNSAIFIDGPGERWTPVIFLIGLCVSLLLFGMTHRDAAARAALERR